MLYQLVHVYIELLFEGKKFVGYMLVAMPWDVEKCRRNWEGTDKFAYDTDKICVCLSLLQRLERAVAMSDDAFAVRPSSQCRRLFSGVNNKLKQVSGSFLQSLN